MPNINRTSMLLGWIIGRQIGGRRPKPVPPWEGTIVLTEEHKVPLISYGLYVTDLPAEFPVEAGRRYALTIDGQRFEYTAEAVMFNGYSNEYVGNKYLGIGIWDSGTPDGPDFCLWSTYKDGEHLKNEFSARFPGTYNIRIEEVT